MIEDLWYKNAVIYALNVDSFMDGNGDGCGDFEGLTRRLASLESLGIDAVWIGPFQTSPNRDNGYDIADSYSVDKRFGSNGDYVEFMNHPRGGLGYTLHVQRDSGAGIKWSRAVCR